MSCESKLTTKIPSANCSGSAPEPSGTWRPCRSVAASSRNTGRNRWGRWRGKSAGWHRLIPPYWCQFSSGMQLFGYCPFNCKIAKQSMQLQRQRTVRCDRLVQLGFGNKYKIKVSKFTDFNTIIPHPLFKTCIFSLGLCKCHPASPKGFVPNT